MPISDPAVTVFPSMLQVIDDELVLQLAWLVPLPPMVLLMVSVKVIANGAATVMWCWRVI